MTYFLADLEVLNVFVTADRTRVGLENPVTLMCSIVEDILTTYTYSWMHNGALLSSGTSPTLTFSVLDFGTYDCEVLSAVSIGRGSVRLVEGGESLLDTQGPPY